MFLTFLEEAPKWSAIFLQSLPHKLAWFVPSDLLGVSAHVAGSDILGDLQVLSSSGLWLFGRPFGGASSGLLIVPKSFLILVFSKFLGRTALQLQVTSLEVPFMTSVVLVSIRRRFRQASSLISNSIFSVALFPHVMWGGEGKIEVTEEFVSSVLRFFYYWLTLSSGDFAKYRTRLVWILKKNIGLYNKW